MPDIRESATIAGVKLVHLQSFDDERGRFLETFRTEWFPERVWNDVQTNRSDSKKNVLRGLHFHHKQVDYWYLLSGAVRVGLYDLRRSSSTRGAGEVIDLSDKEPMGVFVPVGVAHGYLALTDSVITYVVDNYYDNRDEHGVAWNDPDIGLNWGVESPLLSPRDQKNVNLAQIAVEQLPG